MIKPRLGFARFRRSGVLITLMASIGALLIELPVSALYDGLAQNQRYFFPNNAVPAVIQEAVLPAVNLLDGACSFTYHGGAGQRAVPTNVNDPRMAMPADRAFVGGNNRDRKQSYMNFLRATYNNNTGGSCSSPAWRHDGAAFIVRTMLGYPRGSSPNIDDATWNEFQTRIVDNDSIEMTMRSASPAVNSHAFGYRDPVPQGADFAFYVSASPDADWMYEFQGGGYYYGIKLRCGNPSGDINTQINWDLSVQSQVTSAPNRPGETIQWRHTVINNGPQATTATVSYGHRGVGGNNDNAWSRATGLGSGAVATQFSSYTIQQSDVGTNVCRSTVARPRASYDSGTIVSSPACVYIPYNFELTPTVSATRDFLEPGVDVDVSGTVSNAGPTKSFEPPGPPSVAWRLSRFVVEPDETRPRLAAMRNTGSLSAVTSNDDACRYFLGNNGVECNESELYNENRAPSVPAGGSQSVIRTYTTEDYPVGTRICFVMSVAPTRVVNDSVSGNRWAHSRPSCITMAKRPKTQVWGGDLMVGRSMSGAGIDSASKVQTSLTIKEVSGSQRAYGSWVEYGVFAPATVTGTASGSGLNGGTTSHAQSNWSKLTFANTLPSAATAGYPCSASTSQFGCYTSSNALIPQVASQFEIPTNNAQKVSGTVSLTSAPKRRVLTTDGNTLRLSASELRNNEWIVLNVPNTVVTIAGNLRYNVSGRINGIAEIPQLIIIAREINVEAGVNQIDAWLVASGSISTCNERGSAGVLDAIASWSSPPNANKLTSDTCNEELRVNGPVMANKLYLRRTAGSGTGAASGDPAEVFNLRADAYLWARQYVNADLRIRTVYIDELPPRF